MKQVKNVLYLHRFVHTSSQVYTDKAEHVFFHDITYLAQKKLINVFIVLRSLFRNGITFLNVEVDKMSQKIQSQHNNEQLLPRKKKKCYFSSKRSCFKHLFSRSRLFGTTYDKQHAPHCYKYPILKINYQKFIIIQVVDSFLVNKPSGNLFICVPGMQIKRASAHQLIYSIFFRKEFRDIVSVCTYVPC